MADRIIDNEDDINLRDITNFFKRNRSIILKFASIGAIIGITSSLITKRTWRGEFQIVVEQEQSSSSNVVQSLINDPRVSGFAGNVGLNTKNKKLETEVEILRSPSVLFPIYDYVKKSKEDSQKPFGKSYEKWFNSSISVNLKRGTSVLNFSYKDKDKDLIVPTLEEISKKYQAYSGEERNRNIDNGLLYLGEQIKKYKKISSNSISKALNFAYVNNLISETDEFSALPAISSEEIRIEAVSKLKLVEKQLAQVDKIPQNSELIYAFAKKIYQDNQIRNSIDSPINVFKKISSELISKKVIYKDQDPIIRNLLIQRESNLSLIRNELINDLNAEKEQLNAIIDANKKPREVITKYVELMLQAAEDSKILMGLKANQSSLTLKKAETKEPWKLITKPTLDDYPIAPNRKIMSLIWLIVGTISGISTAYIQEQRKGIIFSASKMKKLFKIPFIEELNFNNKKETYEILNLLTVSKLKIPKNEEIAIIPIGDIKKELLDMFIGSLKKLIVNNEIKVTSDFPSIRDCSCQIFIASLGVTKQNEIDYFEKLLNLAENNTIGWFLISNN